MPQLLIMDASPPSELLPLADCVSAPWRAVKALIARQRAKNVFLRRPGIYRPG